VRHHRETGFGFRHLDRFAPDRMWNGINRAMVSRMRWWRERACHPLQFGHHAVEFLDQRRRFRLAQSIGDGAIVP
jgi:hypothetical protein